MTLEESANLINNMQFRSRVKAACLVYASRILAERGTHNNAQIRWAQQTFSNSDNAAQLTIGPTAMEPGVQGPGASIDDGGLQFSVENAVNKAL
jgi:hypothetical protein